MSNQFSENLECSEESILNYNQKGLGALHTHNLAEAESFFLRAKQLLQQIPESEDSDLSWAITFNSLGSLERTRNDMKSAVSYFKQALKTSKMSVQVELENANSHLNLANIYRATSSVKGLNHAHKGLELFKKHLHYKKDLCNSVGLAYYYIGSCYLSSKHLKKAQEYFKIGWDFCLNYKTSHNILKNLKEGFFNTIGVINKYPIETIEINTNKRSSSVKRPAFHSKREISKDKYPAKNAPRLHKKIVPEKYFPSVRPIRKNISKFLRPLNYSENKGKIGMPRSSRNRLY